jgi:bacterioferritin-associated ferredoxin
MYLCICRAVSEKEIERVVAEGKTSFEAICSATGAASCCGTCEPNLRSQLDALTLTGNSTVAVLQPQSA